MTIRENLAAPTGQIDPNHANGGISSHFPGSAGFLTNTGTTHASRTLMLKDLRLLLAACDQGADIDAYRAAVVDKNVLMKSTMSTRRHSFRSLRELYGLSPQLLIFSSMRELWNVDESSQPLLALLGAAARDHILRATVDLIISTPKDNEVTPDMFRQAVSGKLPATYQQATLSRIGRNTVSSWQQSGHLKGRLKKVRSQAHCTPATAAYALLLSYLSGAEGNAQFRNLFVQLLDVQEHEVRRHAIAASRQGWLEYRESGGVTEVTFRHLLRSKETE